MGKLFRYILSLLFLGIVALAGYALVGDLSPQQSDITVPVEGNAG